MDDVDCSLPPEPVGSQQPSQDEEPTGDHAPRAMLTGGRGGPSGWAVTIDAGPPKAVTLEELRHMERQLLRDGNRDAALVLGRQIATLEDVADAWRRVDASEPNGDPAASGWWSGLRAGAGRGRSVGRRWGRSLADLAGKLRRRRPPA